MKPFLSSVVLLLSALAAQAEVSVVTGGVYDVGKGSYSTDASVANKADKEYCWLATAANVFQHWQDRYLTEEEIDTKGIPDGIAGGYSNPGGTQHLEIYQTFLPNFKDKGGLFSNAVDWYFNGKTGTCLNTGAGKGGYLPGQVSSTYYVYWAEKQDNTFTDMAGLKYALDQAFRSEGVAVYLGIITPSNSGHAITCWGYETDADGNLSALYVTDSDDRQYGARRVDLHVESGGKISLSSPSRYGSYSSGTYTINEVSMLVSTAEPFASKAANPTLDTLPEDGGISGARDITGKRLSTPSGIATQPESMLVSSGGEGTSLALGGELGAQGVGFTAKAGSMVSLNDTAVSVSGFSGGGISVGCEMYLDGGSVSVTNNGGIGINLQGSAENPKVYLQMKGNSSVELSGNAGEEGAALRVGTKPVQLATDKTRYTAGSQADIIGNGKVEFTGNDAGTGSVVYNAGALAIEDNGSVTFSRNTAKYDIYNAGVLTLVANAGQGVTFQHGVKNSATGTATLGAGEAATYAFKDGAHGVSLTLASATIGNGGGAVMEDGVLTLSDAVFAGDVTVDFGYFGDGNKLSLCNVTLGSTLILTLDLEPLTPSPLLCMGAASLTETTVINLGDYLEVDGGTSLSGAVSLTVNGQLADGSDLVIETAGLLSESAVTLADYTLSRTEDGKLYYSSSRMPAGSNVPEPATATLSLLALAALVSRRRRK